MYTSFHPYTLVSEISVQKDGSTQVAEVVKPGEVVRSSGQKGGEKCLLRIAFGKGGETASASADDRNNGTVGRWSKRNACVSLLTLSLMWFANWKPIGLAQRIKQGKMMSTHKINFFAKFFCFLLV